MTTTTWTMVGKTTKTWWKTVVDTHPKRRTKKKKKKKQRNPLFHPYRAWGEVYGNWDAGPPAFWSMLRNRKMITMMNMPMRPRMVGRTTTKMPSWRRTLPWPPHHHHKNNNIHPLTRLPIITMRWKKMSGKTMLLIWETSMTMTRIYPTKWIKCPVACVNPFTKPRWS